jgi:signal transduction histidine kinase/FixJ family two-component response regulator
MPDTRVGSLLVVDDEVELMKTLCVLLEEQNYDVVGCASPAEALPALNRRDFDILLVDLMMPEMDGIALLQAGLAIDPHLVGIVMTGQGTIHTAVQAMKSGAFDYLLKPFKATALQPILSRAMQVRRLRLENLQLRETLGIYELSQAVAFTLDTQSILNKVTDCALQQCQADEASLMLPTEDGKQLYIASVGGEERQFLLGQRIPVDQGIAGWVARHQEPLQLDGEVDDPRFEPIVKRRDIHSAVSMPMLAGNDFVGILNVNATERRRPFSLGEVKALSILAGIAASALQNACLYAQVEKGERELREINQELESRVKERTAQLESALKELEAFSYSVSHDLRAPLRAIDGFSRILQEEFAAELPGQARHWLDRVLENAGQMDRLIDDLLSFSRLSRQPLKTQCVNPVDLVNQVLENLGPEINERRVEIRVAELPACEADPVLLRQVFQNLLSNAVKYSRKRKLAEIDVGFVDEDGSRAYFVKDNGVGFDMRYAGKLFGVFQRLHTADEYEGTGVGLAIVQRIVHRHGGQVWARAKVDKGATFFFTLEGETQNA